MIEAPVAKGYLCIERTSGPNVGSLADWRKSKGHARIIA